MGKGYHLLNEVVADENEDKAFKLIWKMKILSKVAHFVWRLVKNRLPTKANLRRRNVQLDDYHCPFCSCHEEEASHIFFGCQRIMPLWWESLAWTEVVTVFLASPREHFLRHSYCKASGIVQNRWWMWRAALTWCIWNHRNRIAFSNDNFNGQKLMEDAILDRKSTRLNSSHPSISRMPSSA